MNDLRNSGVRGSYSECDRYASATIVLGEREYVLPIVVLHCVEEVYRTGFSPIFIF